MALAAQSEMRVDFLETGMELKWCIFTKGIRSSIAKIVVDPKNKGKNPMENQPTAHVVVVFVKPEFRGRGLGEKLLRIAQRSLKENGFIWLTLEAEEKVNLFGKLVGLYERCDFEIFPVNAKIALEYNDDECYRKVPMRCNLLTARLSNENVPPQCYNAPPSLSTSTTVSTSSLVPESYAYRDPFFVEELKREALRLLGTCPLHLDIPSAISWIELNSFPGSLEHAFRTACLLRNKGHPDWMELAGFLRHLGKIQERWITWHAPFMIETRGRLQRVIVTKVESDNSEMEEEPTTKTGPLPTELTSEYQEVTFIEPERYLRQGVDECVVNWTPNEYAYLCLTYAQRSSAPHEMAQLLRYWNCRPWLNTNEYSQLQTFGDQDVKELVTEFSSILTEVEQQPKMTQEEIELCMPRFLQLVDKYVADVMVM